MEALSVRRLQISIRGRNGAVFQVGLQSQRLGTRFRFPLIGTREAYLAVGSGLFEKHTHRVAKGGRLLFCVFSFSAFSFFFAQVSLGIIGWPATFFFHGTAHRLQRADPGRPANRWADPGSPLLSYMSKELRALLSMVALGSCISLIH